MRAKTNNPNLFNHLLTELSRSNTSSNEPRLRKYDAAYVNNRCRLIIKVKKYTMHVFMRINVTQNRTRFPSHICTEICSPFPFASRE